MSHWEERNELREWIHAHPKDPLFSLFQLNRIRYQHSFDRLKVKPSGYQPGLDAINEVIDLILITKKKPDEILIDWVKQGRCNIPALQDWPEQFPDLFKYWAVHRLKGEV